MAQCHLLKDISTGQRPERRHQSATLSTVCHPGRSATPRATSRNNQPRTVTTTPMEAHSAASMQNLRPKNCIEPAERSSNPRARTVVAPAAGSLLGGIVVPSPASRCRPGVTPRATPRSPRVRGCYPRAACAAHEPCGAATTVHDHRLGTQNPAFRGATFPNSDHDATHEASAADSRRQGRRPLPCQETKVQIDCSGSGDNGSSSPSSHVSSIRSTARAGETVSSR
jgi:hypothetical protein